MTIKNFKSVQDLTLSLSRFNILIGANGSGKSNILEAIAFGSAGVADKLDNEFLASRGIRTSESRLMKSAFDAQTKENPIEIKFQLDSGNCNITIEESDKPILKWYVRENDNSQFLEIINRVNKLHIEIDDVEKEISKIKHASKNNEPIPKDKLDKLANANDRHNEESSNLRKLLENMKSFLELGLRNNNLSNFIIYSPEIAALRKLEEESQIQPLGIKGEGLFSLLQVFNENYGPETINELKEYLQIIEWFQDFDAISDNVSSRKILTIKDRFIKEVSLNQNNVNEGFLYLLFYISLFISKETPSFFAIDNIEASFHPKLCEELIKQLIKLSEKYNKQVILTTHNPFVLDGLELNDKDQSLFVVRRNADGETIADKIKTQPKNVKLSEAWTLGYIGGHPETIE